MPFKSVSESNQAEFGLILEVYALNNTNKISNNFQQPSIQDSDSDEEVLNDTGSCDQITLATTPPADLQPHEESQQHHQPNNDSIAGPVANVAGVPHSDEQFNCDPYQQLYSSTLGTNYAQYRVMKSLYYWPQGYILCIVIISPSPPLRSIFPPSKYSCGGRVILVCIFNLKR